MQSFASPAQPKPKPTTDSENHEFVGVACKVSTSNLWAHDEENDPSHVTLTSLDIVLVPPGGIYRERKESTLSSEFTLGLSSETSESHS